MSHHYHSAWQHPQPAAQYYPAHPQYAYQPDAQQVSAEHMYGAPEKLSAFQRTMIEEDKRFYATFPQARQALQTHGGALNPWGFVSSPFHYATGFYFNVSDASDDSLPSASSSSTIAIPSPPLASPLVHYSNSEGEPMVQESPSYNLVPSDPYVRYDYYQEASSPITHMPISPANDVPSSSTSTLAGAILENPRWTESPIPIETPQHLSHLVEQYHHHHDTFSDSTHQVHSFLPDGQAQSQPSVDFLSTPASPQSPYQHQASSSETQFTEEPSSSWPSQVQDPSQGVLAPAPRYYTSDAQILHEASSTPTASTSTASAGSPQISTHASTSSGVHRHPRRQSRMVSPHSHSPMSKRMSLRRTPSPRTRSIGAIPDAGIAADCGAGAAQPPSPQSGKRQQDKKPPLACLFCRGRKIACGPPVPGSKEKTCK
ncbi:hypothetical protein AX16_008279 [Volvariella volvacea WC 439]|nr:hypothetical protein AX16_008279 [Volvariella volvacea WC 439]